jgi:ubiquinone/menaquinone biosynthesis C-methylase UbiE
VSDAPGGYDDELWGLVPEQRGDAPGHVVGFVRELGPAERVLDLGGGDGRLATELEAEELTVADVSAVALERAARRLSRARLVRVEPDRPLPFDDSSFDLVLCADVLEHVRDVQLFMSEARRVLRSGGRLAVATPAHGRLTGLDVLVRGFERRFPPLSPHLRFLTRRSLARLLDDMGFEPLSIRRRRGDLLALARR